MLSAASFVKCWRTMFDSVMELFLLQVLCYLQEEVFASCGKMSCMMGAGMVKPRKKIRAKNDGLIPVWARDGN
jgi:hypothetical protein